MSCQPSRLLMAVWPSNNVSRKVGQDSFLERSLLRSCALQPLGKDAISISSVSPEIWTTHNFSVCDMFCLGHGNYRSLVQAKCMPRLDPKCCHCTRQSQVLLW